jgi:hypothetical protein
VEGRETPLSKVVVPMPKVTPIIGKQESEVAFEARIVAMANLLVGNYYALEHNSYTGFGMGDSIACSSWAVCFISLIRSPSRVYPKKDRLLLLLRC